MKAVPREDDLDGLPEKNELLFMNRKRWFTEGIQYFMRHWVQTLPLALVSIPATSIGQVKSARSPGQVFTFLQQMAGLQDAFYSPSTPYPALNGVAESEAFALIARQEKAQLQYLTTTLLSLGQVSPPTPVYDFTQRTISDPVGTFPDFKTQYSTFLTVAQLIEDSVSRAYIGQAKYLVGNQALLTTFLGLQSIHARQAGFIRTIRAARGLTQSPNQLLKPWVTLDGLIASGGLIKYTADSTLKIGAGTAQYAGEANTLEAQIELQNINNFSQVTPTVASESFDEPLASSDLLRIFKPFLV